MAQAVVLAAGLSSRAKINKMALEIQGTPVLVRVIRALQVHCSDIVVVTGHYRDEVEALIGDMEGVRCVYNAGYEKGMFSSVQTGVGEMTEDFFLTPGDYPLLKPSTLATLLRHRGPVRVPTFEGRGGHPIFISGSLIEALLKEPYDSNLKRFRDRQTVTWVPVDDRGSIEDMDTIEDYENIHEMIKRAKD